MTNGPLMQALDAAIKDELETYTVTYPKLAQMLLEKGRELLDKQRELGGEAAANELQQMAAAVQMIVNEEGMHYRRFTKMRQRLEAIQMRMQLEGEKFAKHTVQPGHIGSPHATKPDYLFWGVLGATQAERAVERFREAGLSRAYLEGAGNLVDIYVHKDDFQKATDAARGQVYRVTGFR